jgi:hypothetical protein
MRVGLQNYFRCFVYVPGGCPSPVQVFAHLHGLGFVLELCLFFFTFCSHLGIFAVISPPFVLHCLPFLLSSSLFVPFSYFFFSILMMTCSVVCLDWVALLLCQVLFVFFFIKLTGLL